MKTYFKAPFLFVRENSKSPEFQYLKFTLTLFHKSQSHQNIPNISCPLVDTLSINTFVNVCVVSNVGSDKAFQTALQTCCGSSNVNIVDNGCYTYCNITTIDDELLWSACLSDNLADIANIDGTCLDNFGLDGTGTSASGRIATTWTFPNVVTTLSSGATLTLGFGDNTLTGSAATATSKGAATKTSSSTATPTASKKASEAALGPRLSFWAGLVAGLGFWRFLV
jgi:hypothetical protein